jgi:hypothetical protein
MEYPGLCKSSWPVHLLFWYAGEPKFSSFPSDIWNADRLPSERRHHAPLDAVSRFFASLNANVIKKARTFKSINKGTLYSINHFFFGAWVLFAEDKYDVPLFGAGRRFPGEPLASPLESSYSYLNLDLSCV